MSDWTPPPKVTGTSEDGVFYYVMTWPDSKREAWQFRWQVNARKNGWTPPKKARIKVLGPAT